MLLQDITYWAPTGFGAEGVVFAAPAAIKGRWEEIAEAFITPAGEESVSEAIVFCSVQVVVGGYVYLGTSVATDPTEVASAYKIRQRISIPDLRNVRSEYRAIL